jgi:hypothetical protein
MNEPEAAPELFEKCKPEKYKELLPFHIQGYQAEVMNQQQQQIQNMQFQQSLQNFQNQLAVNQQIRAQQQQQLINSIA